MHMFRSTRRCRESSSIAVGAWAEFHVPFSRAKVGEFDVDLVVEFFRALSITPMSRFTSTTCGDITPTTKPDSFQGLWSCAAYGHRGDPAMGGPSVDQGVL